MVSKCPNCGKSFKIAKGMRIHRASCYKKDPFGVRGMERQLEKNLKDVEKGFRF